MIRTVGEVGHHSGTEIHHETLLISTCLLLRSVPRRERVRREFAGPRADRHHRGGSCGRAGAGSRSGVYPCPPAGATHGARPRARGRTGGGPGACSCAPRCSGRGTGIGERGARGPGRGHQPNAGSRRPESSRLGLARPYGRRTEHLRRSVRLVEDATRPNERAGAVPARVHRQLVFCVVSLYE